jgi:hypothetical protein
VSDHRFAIDELRKVAAEICSLCRAPRSDDELEGEFNGRTHVFYTYQGEKREPCRARKVHAAIARLRSEQESTKGE